GAGKSTVSRRLAQALNYRYIDTGAMYRVIGVLAAEQGITLDDSAALAALCDRTDIQFAEGDGQVRTLANERDLSAAIRTPAAAKQADKGGGVPGVREGVEPNQGAWGAGGGGGTEGRDTGTVVSPDAPVKPFLDASPRERARRRASELSGGAPPAEIER